MTLPRVLFVSKPLVAPWNDGSKNLVRDVTAHLTAVTPVVLGTATSASPAPGVEVDRVYSDAGRFAPGLAANARVARRLLFGEPHDAWHFAFAPNAKSSSVARGARAWQRARGWRGPVLQTVASALRRVDPRWLFGDVVVALSEHTASRIREAGLSRDRLRVVPPCARAPEGPFDERMRSLRRTLAIADGPIVLYPGDYEVSSGARTMWRAAPRILEAHGDAVVVLACRAKTEEARAIRAELAAEVSRSPWARRVVVLGDVDDMHALLASAAVVLFPVDDLYGKVDLPLVLLEAMALGVPCVVAAGGPLEELTGVACVAPRAPDRLADEAVRLLSDEEARAALGASGRAGWERSLTPEAVAGRYDAIYRELLPS